MLAFLIACDARLAVTGADTGRPPENIIGDSAETADTATESEDTGELVWDCAALPSRGDFDDNELEGPRGYHDVIFDNAGNILGSDGSTLMSATYEGVATPVVPGVGTLQGMARLPDGDIVAADDLGARLLRITAEGATSTLAGDLPGIYGVTVGPDGMIYTGPILRGARAEMVRVDPATGLAQQWVRLPAIDSPRMVVFSVDNTVGYIATTGRALVYAVDLDADLNPIGEARVYAEGVGNGWQDGIGLDVCGNLYIPDYASSGLYRVAPDGTSENLFRPRAGIYGHGLEWGSGIGGWRQDAIYMPQPYDQNTVREVVVGAPSADRLRSDR